MTDRFQSMAGALDRARRTAGVALAALSLLACSGGGGGTGGATTTSSSTTASTTTSSVATGGSGGAGGSTPLPPCQNGVKDDAETDVDCGGGTCPACDDEKVCAQPSDCQSLSCAAGKCAAATCGDQIRNQGEPDEDCGGPCAACGDGKACFAALDCVSKVCAAGHCAAASCIDGVKNGDETDTDCGGGCLPCVGDKHCAGPGDCISQLCIGGVCLGDCNDGIQDGDETDIDCGGATCQPCADKLACAAASDCASGACAAGACAPATCLDGTRNSDETDTDCGGPCGPCADGRMCAGDGDCLSQVCQAFTCAAASCNDQTQNQSETDTDCGGFCAPCASGKACLLDTDCQSKVCLGNACEVATCGDFVRNQNETDTDCGGPCPACGDNKGCITGNDCVSKICNGVSCVPATCTDNVKNQNETDTDCGGSCAQKCGVNKACAVSGDCGLGMSCIAGECNHPIVALSASDQTCALRANGILKCWGRNNFGQLGIGSNQNRGDSPNEMGTNLPSPYVGRGGTVKAVAAGNNFTCAILGDNTVKCWGQNDEGQLGQGDTMNRGTSNAELGDNLPPVNLGAGRTAVKIGAGQKHACAILDNDTLKCWGRNDTGQLGIGSNADRGSGPNQMGDNLPAVSLGTGRKPVALGLQWNETCVLLDNAQVKCFGASYGVGTLPSHMGDNLIARNMGTGRTVLAIAPGASHQCALLDNAQVKCWGSNDDGRLGLGNVGAYDGSEGNALPAVNLGTGRTAKALACPLNSCCAILDDDTLKCWGNNTHGELGQGDKVLRGAVPADMGDNLLPVPLVSGRKPVAIMGGFQDACVVLDDLTLRCWGANGSGELGQGGGGDRGDQPNEMGNNLPITFF